MFDFEQLLHPVQRKACHVHPECVKLINSGRKWANKDFAKHVFANSVEILAHYKKRRWPILPFWLAVDVDLATIAAYGGEEGDRVIDGRLLVMLPTDAVIATGGLLCTTHVIGLTDLLFFANQFAEGIQR